MINSNPSKRNLKLFLSKPSLPHHELFIHLKQRPLCQMKTYQELLQVLKQHSQIVILDTPHLGLGDGLSIVSLCDEVLLVVHDGVTKMSAIWLVEEQLQVLQQILLPLGLLLIIFESAGFDN